MVVVTVKPRGVDAQERIQTIINAYTESNYKFVAVDADYLYFEYSGQSTKTIKEDYEKIRKFNATTV